MHDKDFGFRTGLGIAMTVLVAALAAASLALSGCAATDVVAKVAATSFKAVSEAAGPAMARSDTLGAWVLTSPEGDRVAFSDDFSREGQADVAFSVAAAPFLAAGLDPARLPGGGPVAFTIAGDRLEGVFELGSSALGPDAARTPAGLMAGIARIARDRIGYHEKLDHYGIALGQGHMFEWAKDPSRNDKDLVWILDPAPFVAAGADPARIAGWVFAKVETKDAQGKAVTVDKLLRPFDLK